MSKKKTKPSWSNWAFKRAEKYINNIEKTEDLIKDVSKKAETHRGRLDSTWEDLNILIKMVNARISGDYKISKRTLVLIIGGLIYFLNPFDLIPDPIIGLGFIDDATVLYYVVDSIKEDIEKFKDWSSSST